MVLFVYLSVRAGRLFVGCCSCLFFRVCLCVCLFYFIAFFCLFVFFVALFAGCCLFVCLFVLRTRSEHSAVVEIGLVVETRVIPIEREVEISIKCLHNTGVNTCKTTQNNRKQHTDKQNKQNETQIHTAVTPSILDTATNNLFDSKQSTNKHTKQPKNNKNETHTTRNTKTEDTHLSIDSECAICVRWIVQIRVQLTAIVRVRGDTHSACEDTRTGKQNQRLHAKLCSATATKHQ